VLLFCKETTLINLKIQLKIFSEKRKGENEWKNIMMKGKDKGKTGGGKRNSGSIRQQEGKERYKDT
jgi:hypothetical protein